MTLLTLTHVSAQDEDYSGEKIFNLMMKKIDSINELNDSLEWKEVRNRLYINKNGDLGFKYTRELAVFYNVEDYRTVFADTGTALTDIIDAGSFIKIAGDDEGSGAFYRDKRYVYRYSTVFQNGPVFDILTMVDYRTFNIIDDYYARDKNYIYLIPVGAIEIDATSSKILTGKCFAKDKYGYYRGINRLSEEQLHDPEIKELKEKIDKL